MAHHLTAGDSPKDVKFGTQLVIIYIILHILHFEVSVSILSQLRRQQSTPTPAPLPMSINSMI